MKDDFLELIRLASTKLPDDVLKKISFYRDTETKGSNAYELMDCLLINSELAKKSSRPICQDTGTNIWYVYHPSSVSTIKLEKDIIAATRAATKFSYLRPNSVDSISGKNSGDNIGIGAPDIHFKEWKKNYISADLMLKGGGCENVSAQYSLPDASIKAGRDLNGVRNVVIDAVFKAQGQGCAPGIIGVGIGGDRTSGMALAKKQLFRLLDDVNPDSVLAKLETKLLYELNGLSIGPMGYGGKTTAMAVKIGAKHRVPASFFVSIAYMCWALRRANMTFKNNKASYSDICQMAVIPAKV